MNAIIQRLARRYDDLFLDQFCYIQPLNDETKSSAESMQTWLDNIHARLTLAGGLAVFTSELDYQNAHDFKVTVTKRKHGTSKIFVLPMAFFNSIDYQKISTYANETAGLFNVESVMQMGERQQPVENFKQAFEWMMREIKKGQTIQRYKGLGEMNPEQLWETTLDSNNRRLLQVRIEDAIAADEIFTTLMGDVVEPRRDFIVKHALDVSNLDV